MKALVVDDSPIIRRVLARALLNLKVKTRAASSGFEAMEYLQKDPTIQFLAIDYSMPKMSGVELVSRIRRHSKFDHLKLFVVSASDTPEIIEMTRKAGADDFLVKPLTERLIAEKLRHHGLN